MIWVLKDVFFKDSSEFNCLGIVFGEADTTKHRYALAKASAFADCGDKFWTLIITTLNNASPLTMFTCR